LPLCFSLSLLERPLSFLQFRIGPAEDPKFKETKGEFEEAKKGLDKLQDHVTAYLGAESCALNSPTRHNTEF